MEKSKRRGASWSPDITMCAVGAVALCASGTVLGQGVNNAAESKPPAAATTAKPDQLEEVVVTGIRAGLRSSLEVKRDSLQTIDAISAEDIGDFPDKNVGEALQRVTGVQISRQDGEGRGVSIRGADPSLNRVEINGATALSETVGGGRDVDFRDIPVEFISRLEVVKSPTPEMTEGGLGGTVRVITRRPFDSREPFLSGSAQAVYSDVAEAYDPKFALIGSRLFFDDTFGVLLAATYERRHLYSDNARTTGWLRRANTAAGLPAGRVSDINGDGTLDWIPEIPRYIIDRRLTKRPAFNTVLEWRPNDSVTASLDGTYSKGHEYVSSMFLQLGAANGVIDYANSRVGADNTVSHIELTSTAAFPMDLAYRNILGDLIRTQYTTTAGLKWNVGQFRIDGKLAYANTDVQNNEKNSTATFFGVPRAVIDYSGGEGAPNMSFPGLDVTTGQGVNQLAAVFNPRTNTQNEKTGGFNVEYQPDSNWLTSIKTGAEYRRLNMDSILFSRTVQLSSRTPLPASSGATTTVAASQAAIQAIIDGNSITNDIEFFPVGNLGFGSSVDHWNDNEYDTFNATIAASGLPLDPHGVNVNAGTNGTFQNYLDTWGVEEKTKGAYVQGTFRFGELRVPFGGTLGVRYVDTDTLSTGFARQQQGSVITFPTAERSGGYTKLLPSMNLKFDFSEKLVGRLTAAKVMARASPAQLALRRTLDGVGLTGSRGNPDLKPFEAKQYGAGVEYYLSPEAFFSATYFRNEISSFIINTSQRETSEGEPCDPATSTVLCYNVVRPVNGTDRVTINGIETGAQMPFTFLPSPLDGFGILANYTYQKDKGFKGTNVITGETLPFPGLSRKSYNVSLYYEKPVFSIRASYNWRDQWLITPNGRGALPEFNEAFGSLDATASYNITPDVSAFVEALNLLNEQRFENNNSVRRIGNELFGTRIFFGVRGKF